MAHKITVLPGDGIGPEITKVALNALQAAGKLENEEFDFSEELVGGAAIDATGQPLPQQTLDAAKKSDAVLLAAIGGYDLQPSHMPRGQSATYRPACRMQIPVGHSTS